MCPKLAAAIAISLVDNSDILDKIIFLCRSLELCQPGRVAPPTWAVNPVAAAAATEEAARTDRPLEEELRELVSGEHSKTARSPILHNQSGLNGLATNGVEGLNSVRLQTHDL